MIRAQVENSLILDSKFICSVLVGYLHSLRALVHLGNTLSF